MQCTTPQSVRDVPPSLKSRGTHSWLDIQPGVFYNKGVKALAQRMILDIQLYSGLPHAEAASKEDVSFCMK